MKRVADTQSQSYADTVQMTSEELRAHPEVELCACSHPRGIHAISRDSLIHCKGGHFDSISCECGEFSSTAQRTRNSLISLPHRHTSDVSDLMASIVERHAGSLSRRTLAEDLTALVNAEREKCAVTVESLLGDIDTVNSTEERAVIASINSTLEAAAAKIRRRQ